MTMKGARRIYRRELHGVRGARFRAWVREVVRETPSMGIGLTGKLDHVVRGPKSAAGEIRR